MHGVGSRVLLVVTASLLALPVLILAAVVGVAVLTPGAVMPFAGRTLYVDPESAAASAARSTADESDAELFARMAEQPMAVWLQPEEHGQDEVGAYVAGVAADAERQGSLPVFVLYGIPDRDCGNFSSGGLTPEQYPLWVAEIAAGLTGVPAVVIVEPDALALSVQCGDAGAQAGRVAEAVTALTQQGVSVYIDAGHSDWVSPEVMADLLRQAGVDRATGFATNVSNFNATNNERAYAEGVREALGGTARYVIDTSRNGNGSDGEWCNPPGRALGETPTVVDDGTGLDAVLWIKTPGESDGECNGGPAAGVWWPEGARRLATAAGW